MIARNPTAVTAKARLKAALLRAAAACLEELGAEPGPIEARVSGPDVDLTITSKSWPLLAAPQAVEDGGEAALGGRPGFSSLERRIIDGLAAGGWVKGADGEGGGWVNTATLAQAVGEEPSTEFKVILRNLAALEPPAVETSTKHGVRLLSLRFATAAAASGAD